MRSRRGAVVGSLVAAILLGFFWVGQVLYKTAIDLDSSAFLAGSWIEPALAALGITSPRPIAGPFWMVVGLLLVLVGVFFVVRRAVQLRVAETDPGRRSLLTGAATGAGVALASTVLAGGVGFARAFYGIGNGGRGWRGPLTQVFGGDVVKTDPDPRPSWQGSRIREFRRLGRTGFEISDIVVGAGRARGEKGTDVVRRALDRGVNYVDTSPDYSATGSEQAVGAAVQGRRDQVFLATKFCTPRGHLGPGSSVADYMGVVEASLSRLGTDYVDLVHIHSCDEIDRLMDEDVHEAFDRLKEQGKARFLGFSSHTPNLVQVAEKSIESGRFDVMMLAYHHGIWPRIAEVIGRAHNEADMGVVAMKTLKGAKHHGLAGFRESADAYSQAALKWTLSNLDVSAAIISFFEYQHVDEYLFASGQPATETDLALLRVYDREILGSYCAPHCGACLSRCPEGLPIHDVLRHRMYFEDYGDEKEAMRLYSRLDRDASVCASCSAPCLGSCPVGIPIRERMAGAHDLLSLS